jgi:hypothetical protein
MYSKVYKPIAWLIRFYTYWGVNLGVKVKSRPLRTYFYDGKFKQKV